MEILENVWFLAAVAVIASVAFIATSVVMWRRTRRPTQKMMLEYKTTAIVRWEKRPNRLLAIIMANPLRSISIGAMLTFILFGILGTYGVLWITLKALLVLVALVTLVGVSIVWWSHRRHSVQEGGPTKKGISAVAIWMILSGAVFMAALSWLIIPIWFAGNDVRLADTSVASTPATAEVETSSATTTSVLLSAGPTWSDWQTMPITTKKWSLLADTALDLEFRNARGEVVSRRHIPKKGFEVPGTWISFRSKAVGNEKVVFTMSYDHVVNRM